MSFTLPATGTSISMGRAGYAYSGLATTTPVSIGSSAPIPIGTGTGVWLNKYIGRPYTLATQFSGVFGGRSTPFNY